MTIIITLTRLLQILYYVPINSKELRYGKDKSIFQDSQKVYKIFNGAAHQYSFVWIFGNLS